MRIFRENREDTAVGGGACETMNFDLYARSPPTLLGHDFNCVSWRAGRRPRGEAQGGEGRGGEGQGGEGQGGEAQGDLAPSNSLDLDNSKQRQLTSCDDNGDISIWLVTVE